MADPLLSGGKVISFPAGREVRPERVEVAAGPSQHHSSHEVSWFEKVASYVRVAAAALPGTAAFVSRDGRHVVVTAPDWTPELSRAGAALVVALLRELKPDADHWIEGGFAAKFEASPDYERVQ